VTVRGDEQGFRPTVVLLALESGGDLFDFANNLVASSRLSFLFFFPPLLSRIEDVVMTLDASNAPFRRRRRVRAACAPSASRAGQNVVGLNDRGSSREDESGADSAEVFYPGVAVSLREHAVGDSPEDEGDADRADGVSECVLVQGDEA